MVVTLYIKILSGDIIPIEHDLSHGLYMLKRKIMKLYPEWSPPQQLLFHSEYPHEMYLQNLSQIKNNDLLYLFIKDTIIYEEVRYIYSIKDISFYCFWYMNHKNDCKTFSFYERDDKFSFKIHSSFIIESVWFSSLEQMIESIIPVLDITSTSLTNILYLWHTRHK